jgi:LmbE family N-acetylglucosaminyl deacetylase
MLNNEFMKYYRVLIMSPHPDDDVIGMAITIKKFIDEGKSVWIMYQTTGARGGDIETRKKESIKALQYLGLNDHLKIIFGNTPFYDSKRDIDSTDINYTMNIIKNIKPEAIFFAGDVDDPNKTHLKCYQIISECLKNLKIKAYNYYSAWYKPEKYDIMEYFNDNLMKLKIKSIQAHQSQINPKYRGNLDCEFYELVQLRNKEDGYDNMYAEGFTLFKKN